MLRMIKIASSTDKSQPPLLLHDATTTPHLESTGAIECNTALPLIEFFLFAVEQNKVYYASKKSAHQYASPLFKLVQCLKSHSQLKNCTAADAFARLNSEVKP